MTKLFTILLSSFFAMALITPATAQQNLFKTVITVNDQSITQYEINQRVLLLSILRAPGDPLEEARKGLIEDRLRLSETGRVGITLSPDEIQGGMEEFAQRADLSAEQFIEALGQSGIASETFRDFVSAGLAWRNLIQSRFGPRANVTEAEVDSALALASTQGSARVLLSEIIVPVNPQNEVQQRALLERLQSTISTTPAFAAAARRYSAARTSLRGGRLEWLPINQLPPTLRAAVLTLQPGQISDLINLGPGIGIFQLRDLEEVEAGVPETQSVEYATVLFPGGRNERNIAAAQELAGSIDTCDDLYTPAKSLPEGAFDRVVLPSSELPSDIALELARLDNNEISTNLTRGDAMVFVMLCGRTLAQPESPEGEAVDVRAQMRNRLFNQRLASYADSFLEELRADALIAELE
ncbi:MAG: peptidylprolyl isomerase [Litoreibacter sp.]